LLDQIDKLKVEVPVEADAVKCVRELHGVETETGALLGCDRIHPSIIRRARSAIFSIAEFKLVPCVGCGVRDSESRDSVIVSIGVDFCLSGVANVQRSRHIVGTPITSPTVVRNIADLDAPHRVVRVGGEHLRVVADA
jgi:hypothetical protein